MAWVRTIEPEAATGQLAEVYERARQRAGRVPNIARLQSLRPQSMSLGFSLYCHLMDDPAGLTRLQRVLIATVVSKINGCYY